MATGADGDAGSTAGSRALLDQLELGAWRGFLAVHARLVRALDQELQAAHDLPLSNYEVLLLLVDQPAGRLRMTELADRALLTPSGISRLVDRLALQGLVERVRAEDDKRGFYAVITDAGRARFATARPTHVGGVRRRFLANVDPDERVVLAGLWQRILVADEAAARSQPQPSGNASG